MKTVEIKSPNNTTFRRFLKLQHPRNIRKYQQALLSGPKQTEEVLENFRDQCTGIIFSGGHEDSHLHDIHDLRKYRLTPELFRHLDVFGTGHPLVMVCAGPFPRFEETRLGTGCTLLIPFQDPGNVGAVIRASAAFGVRQIVLLKEAAHPFHPKSLRAAGSNIFRVHFLEGPAMGELKKLEISLIIMSIGGPDAARFKFPESFCLLPGLEGPGIPEGLKGSGRISIPMAEGVESLNAAMATGIVLYLWRNRPLHF